MSYSARIARRPPLAGSESADETDLVARLAAKRRRQCAKLSDDVVAELVRPTWKDHPNTPTDILDPGQKVEWLVKDCFAAARNTDYTSAKRRSCLEAVRNLCDRIDKQCALNSSARRESSEITESRAEGVTRPSGPSAASGSSVGTSVCTSTTTASKFAPQTKQSGATKPDEPATARANHLEETPLESTRTTKTSGTKNYILDAHGRKTAHAPPRGDSALAGGSSSSSRVNGATCRNAAVASSVRTTANKPPNPVVAVYTNGMSHVSTVGTKAVGSRAVVPSTLAGNGQPKDPIHRRKDVGTVARTGNNASQLQSSSLTHLQEHHTPESFKRYTNKCLSVCATEKEKEFMEKEVSKVMESALKDGSMHSKNWDTLSLIPLPGRNQEGRIVEGSNASSTAIRSTSSLDHRSNGSDASKHKPNTHEKEVPSKESPRPKAGPDRAQARIGNSGKDSSSKTQQGTETFNKNAPSDARGSAKSAGYTEQPISGNRTIPASSSGGSVDDQKRDAARKLLEERASLRQARPDFSSTTQTSRFGDRWNRSSECHGQPRSSHFGNSIGSQVEPPRHVGRYPSDIVDSRAPRADSHQRHAHESRHESRVPYRELDSGRDYDGRYSERSSRSDCRHSERDRSSSHGRRNSSNPVDTERDRSSSHGRRNSSNPVEYRSSGEDRRRGDSRRECYDDSRYGGQSPRSSRRDGISEQARPYVETRTTSMSQGSTIPRHGSNTTRTAAEAPDARRRSFETRAPASTDSRGDHSDRPAFDPPRQIGVASRAADSTRNNNNVGPVRPAEEATGTQRRPSVATRASEATHGTKQHNSSTSRFVSSGQRAAEQRAANKPRQEPFVEMFMMAERPPTFSGSLLARSNMKIKFNPTELSDSEINRLSKRLDTWEPFWRMTRSLKCGMTSKVNHCDKTEHADAAITAAQAVISCGTRDIPASAWGLVVESWEDGDKALLLRMLPVEPELKKRADCHLWPKGTHIQILGAQARIDQRKQQTHDKSLWKGMCRHLNVTTHIQKPSETTKIQISCYDDKQYAYFLQICEYRSAKTLYKILMSNGKEGIRRLPREVSMAKALSIMQKGTVVVDSDEEARDEVQKFVFSLTCPISRELMQTPVRGRHCKHWQCFDLRNYLKNNAFVSGSRWRCISCECFVPIQDLELCGLTADILEDSMASSERDRVEICSDKTYRFLDAAGRKRPRQRGCNTGGDNKRPGIKQDARKSAPTVVHDNVISLL